MIILLKPLKINLKIKVKENRFKCKNSLTYNKYQLTCKIITNVFKSWDW